MGEALDGPCLVFYVADTHRDKLTGISLTKGEAFEHDSPFGTKAASTRSNTVPGRDELRLTEK